MGINIGLGILEKAVVKKAYVAPQIGVPIFKSSKIKDVVDIDPQKRLKSFKDRLNNVLQSEHCETPDYMARIPKNSSNDEKIRLLKQMFEESKFFSRVSTCEMMYGKNFAFAEMMSQLSKKTSKLISNGKSFEDVLNQIAKGYSKETTINSNLPNRIDKSGIYRGDATKPPEIIEDWGRVDSCITGYGLYGVKDGYKAYVERLNANLNKRISPYENFTLTKRFDETMLHPYHEEVAKNMEIISSRYEEFQKLVENYNKTGNLTTEQRDKADNIISEIYYLMANTCPFKRGSNGISDVLMRSQYSALGINMPHIKKGVGLDLEAFCMNLDEYKLKWNSFFES